MNFATLLAKIWNLLPTAVLAIDNLEDLVGSGKLSYENKRDALKAAMTLGGRTADLVKNNQIPRVADFEIALDMLVSAVLALHASMKPKL